GYVPETDTIEEKKYPIKNYIKNSFEKDTDEDIEDYVTDLDFFIPDDSIMEIVAFEMRRRLCYYRECKHTYDKSFEQSYNSIAHHLFLENVRLIDDKKCVKKIIAKRSIEGEGCIGEIHKMLEYKDMLTVTINYPVNNKDVQKIGEEVKKWRGEIMCFNVQCGFLKNLDLENLFIYFPELQCLSLKNNKNLLFTSADQKAYKEHNLGKIKKLSYLRFQNCTFASLPLLYHKPMYCQTEINVIDIIGKMSDKRKKYILRNTRNPLRLMVHEAIPYLVPIGIFGLGWVLCTLALYSLPNYYGQQDWQKQFLQKAALLVKKYDKDKIEHVWKNLLSDLANTCNTSLRALWKIDDGISLQVLSGAMNTLFSMQTDKASQCFSIPVSEIQAQLLNVVWDALFAINGWNQWVNVFGKVIPALGYFCVAILEAVFTYREIKNRRSWFCLPVQVGITKEEEQEQEE
ncbi:MAG TPA: hypothetical protein VEK38_01330, partial [Candidatus Bathyarchaeia archaeon]|nr:hypothetical protein [Candidatus Bathyarchaeia archaeon]